MNGKPRNSLGRKTLTGIIIFAVTLIIVVCVAVGIGTYYHQVNEYNRQAYNYTRAAADFINGDTIHRYVTTERKDEYYYLVQNYL
ncbi:MAG: hypothetical protein J6D57_07525, partial [Mogibacterium sp.]|nr:hypothetical protein [Mogibacterium sp.]